MAAGPYCKHFNHHAQGLVPLRCWGYHPSFFLQHLCDRPDVGPPDWPGGRKIWMTTLHIAQWACEIRFWAQPKRIPKSTVYRLRRIYCGFSKVLIESIMACGIVKFPLKIAFDLETTPYIYFELPGDLSARGPAAWICAPHISHIRKQVWCRAS